MRQPIPVTGVSMSTLAAAPEVISGRVRPRHPLGAVEVRARAGPIWWQAARARAAAMRPVQ
jgi:hypothetical protein